MGIKKLILNIVLSICNVFIRLRPIQKNKIAFISLESKKLESDLKLIYDGLDTNKYHLVTVLTNFKKNSLWMNFLYFLNTIKQIFVINTSTLVIINDNNYVVSKFKRKGVKILQVWHAAGAIKKFGNAIPREYPISNYDFVICNGKYWIKPYSQAFGVKEEQVKAIGMPRLDHLCNKNFIEKSRTKLYRQFPELKGKKVILYAPTFRGDIYQGMRKVNINVNFIITQLGEEYAFLFKLHPLLKTEIISKDRRVYNMNQQDLHELFSITDILISDFSSIIFDFSLLNKPIYYFVPDLDQYLDERGCFVDYRQLMKGCIAENEQQLVELIRKRVPGNEKYFANILTPTAFNIIQRQAAAMLKNENYENEEHKAHLEKIVNGQMPYGYSLEMPSIKEEEEDEKQD